MTRGDLDSLAAFTVVARRLSFTAAAAELRLSTSALSHAIKGLEARLGTRLLHRNSRSVSITKAGEQLLQTLGPALDDIGGALADLGRKRGLVSGTGRVAATHHAFETVIRPVLPGFCASHPGGRRRGANRLRPARHRGRAAGCGHPLRRKAGEGRAGA